MLVRMRSNCCLTLSKLPRDCEAKTRFETSLKVMYTVQYISISNGDWGIEKREHLLEFAEGEADERVAAHRAGDGAVEEEKHLVEQLRGYRVLHVEHERTEMNL